MSRNQETEALLNFAYDEILARYKFDLVDNLIGPPSPEQIKASIEDSLDEINSTGPQTFFTLEYVLKNPQDTRWRRYLYLGAAKNIMQQAAIQFANDSFSIRVGELDVEDRLDAVKTAASDLQTQFTTDIEKLKAASQRFAVGIRPAIGSYPTMQLGRRLSAMRFSPRSVWTR